jgi:hypothetical protein
MVREFSLFHISLIEISEPNFETLRGVSREDWLFSILSEPFYFSYYGGGRLYWVPQVNDTGLIIGVVERSRDRLQHLPPDEGGLEVMKKEWQGAYVVIDPYHHQDGQKMAIENDVVGSPPTIVKYLSQYLNSLEERPYEFEPRAIFDSSDFYAFLRENGNHLRVIKFRFVVPNMWNTAGRIDEELKATGTETGTEEVDVTFKSRRGLRGDSSRVTEAVEYTARGSGSVRATATNGAKYSSTKSPTKSQIEVPDADALESADGSWVANLASRILGRG